MELEGTWINGAIIPDAGFPTQENGTRVRIAQPTTGSAITDPAPPAAPKPGWFWDLVKDLVVDDPDSPGDRAAQHDHYAHGAPKR